MALERPNPIVDDLLARLPMSPDSYVQKFDLISETGLLIQFDANAFRSASFLDDRILRPTTKGGWVALNRIVAAAQAIDGARPLHFIFHTGHVGSTLVSRLLDETRVVLSLREPLALRQLADAHDSLTSAQSLLGEHQFDALLDSFLRLWSRAYATDRCAIVKATSSAGRIAPTILAKRPTTRAIYLNLRAEPYLATLLAGANSPADLRGHAAERSRRLQNLGLADLAPVHLMSLGELAAMSWLAESWSRHDALAQCGARVLAIDFDAFLADVSGGMRRILSQFDLPQGQQFLANIGANPVLTRYAKAPEHAYTPALRAQVLSDSRIRNSEEIRRGLAWVEAHARDNPLAGAVIHAN